MSLRSLGYSGVSQYTLLSANRRSLFASDSSLMTRVQHLVHCRRVTTHLTIACALGRMGLYGNLWNAIVDIIHYFSLKKIFFLKEKYFFLFRKIDHFFFSEKYFVFKDI